METMPKMEPIFSTPPKNLCHHKFLPGRKTVIVDGMHRPKDCLICVYCRKIKDE
jgi:hypothetical protein